MPSFELSVIYKVLTKPELVTALKRTTETLWTNGGFLKKLDNLGTKDLPFDMRAHGKRHSKGSYFVFHFEAPLKSVPEVSEECDRDVDIVRRRVFESKRFRPVDCTLQEESQPPAYRQDVKNLIEEGKRTKRRLFKPYVMVIDAKSY